MKATVRNTIALAVAATICAPHVLAGEPASKASRPESTGVVSGMVVGAAAAGPFGAVLGAATGAWLGDRFNRSHESAQQLAVKLAGNETRLDASEARVRDLGQAMQTADQLTTQLGFRTGSFELRDEQAMAMRRLGALVAVLPDATVDIDGFADARGDEHYNLELSRARAQSVADELALAGVERERIRIAAHGESASVSPEGDADGLALERRVQVTLHLPAGDTASAPRVAMRVD
ncbi:MAG: OmpA family protein [Steroidobacteraceae bacterium]